MTNLAPSFVWQLAEPAPAPGAEGALLASFAAFYEELASIKRCQHEGTLARYLAPELPAPVLADAEYATRTSARLLALMREQDLAFQRQASAQHIQLHRSALYVMAALADEVLLLDLAWAGAGHWLPVLLERRLFRTAQAGLVFFELADKLIAGTAAHPLHADLASVFLLALQLGFKGQHRTAGGAHKLDHYRQQLFRIANGNAGRHRGTGTAPGFLQACQHNITDGKDVRRASWATWRRYLNMAAIGYLVLSSAAWFALMYPLDQLLKP